MAMTRVGEIDIEYYIEGSGPTLLMVMGMGGQAASWSQGFLDLLQRRFTTIRFSNRGTGRSGQSSEVTTIRAMADDAAGLLKALDIESAHVMGISMGGMIAQEVVLNHPQVVQGLVLGCTLCGQAHSQPVPPETLARFAALPALSSDEKIKQFWAMTVTPEFERDHDDFLDNVVRVELESPTPEATLFRQVGAVATFDSYDRLPQIDAPTLILHGDRDMLVVPANGDILHERIAGSRLVTITNAGHCFFWERPEESAKAVIEFLSAVPAAA